MGVSNAGRAKPAADEGAVIAFRDAAQFEAWLDTHVALHVGVWLKIAKKGSGVASLTDDEAVDVGLCYGWISGQRKSFDEVYYLQKYVPRRPRSRWSQVNVAKVEQLEAAGRMRPAGVAEVEAAKADGRWAVAYQSQRNATVPPDLADALAANPPAAQAFEAPAPRFPPCSAVRDRRQRVQHQPEQDKTPVGQQGLEPWTDGL